MPRFLAWIVLCFAVFGGFAVCLAEGARTALAQEPKCGPTEAMLGALHEYGEITLDASVSEDGKYLFWFAGNPETGTWTMLVSDTDGVTCAMQSGKGLKLPQARGS